MKLTYNNLYNVLLIIMLFLFIIKYLEYLVKDIFFLLCKWKIKQKVKYMLLL